MPTFNDWMNNELRSRAATRVDLDEADERLREVLQPTAPGARSPTRTQRASAEPPTTATAAEYRTWLYGEAAPALDDQGRLPGERGYTRPAQDSFDAGAVRMRRWINRKQAEEKAVRDATT
jgi:hypothetical protein